MGKPVDPRLEGFLSRCLARNPADRYQTAIDALNAWRELRPASLPPYVGSPSLPPPTPMPPVATPVPPSTAPRSAPPSQGGVPRSSRFPSTQPISLPPNSPAPSPYPQISNLPVDERLRPRGGTLSMDAAAESTGGPTRPMQRIQSPSEPPQLRAVAPTSLPTPSVRQDPRSVAPSSSVPPAPSPYQDPRSMHGQQYGGPTSYPPAPASQHAQPPYSHPGYGSVAPSNAPSNAQSNAQNNAQTNAQSNVYDESSRGPASTSQTQPTRVYVPHNPNAQSGLTPSPAAMVHGQGGPPGAMQGQGAQPMQQPPSSALRVALWFLGFAIVGFVIVAALHHFKVF